MIKEIRPLNELFDVRLEDLKNVKELMEAMAVEVEKMVVEQDVTVLEYINTQLEFSGRVSRVMKAMHGCRKQMEVLLGEKTVRFKMEDLYRLAVRGGKKTRLRYANSSLKELKRAIEILDRYDTETIQIIQDNGNSYGIWSIE